MTFDELMATVMQWATAADALAALGAEVSLQQSGEAANPELVSALRAVSTAGGLSDLETLAPPQQAMLVGMIRLFLHQAIDLVDQPDRPAGWTVTDPVILDGFGRGSSIVPSLIAAAHPDLAEVTSFLDVGTGVGLLAVAAANVWPAATIVGIDPWETSLERARVNVAQADLEDRITLRLQELAAIDDADAYDCAWVPTFFLTEADLEHAMPALMRAMRPGGWIAFGRSRVQPHPLAEATTALHWIRSGGCTLDTKRAVELLDQAGCTAIHTAQPSGPAPIELVLGRRPVE